MIIQLTSARGNEVAVNLNLVMYMEEFEDETKISFACDSVCVKESVHEIWQKFKESTYGYKSW